MDHGSEVKSSKPSHSSSFSFDEDGNVSNGINGKVLNASTTTSSASKVSDVNDESVLQNWSPMQSPPIQVMVKSGDFDSNRISSSSDPATPDSFSFETSCNDDKDTNGTHSGLEGALNASTSFASKTSDFANESELQNVSPTTQVMENPGGFEANGIPPLISTSKSYKTEGSNFSNESLFSIDMGHQSFSKDETLTTGRDSYKSGELDTHGEPVRYRRMSSVPKGGENNKEAPDNELGAGNTPRTTEIPVEPIKNEVENQPMVPLGVASRTSNKSVDLPMTKKSEPTGCKCCCAGFTCDFCYCSRPWQFNISSGAWLSCQGCCSCKWFSGLSLSCKCLHCCFKLPKCQGWCCCCSKLLPCKKPKFRWCCCESITCSCFYFKCPILRSCRCRGLFCCSSWICCAKNSRSSFDNVAKDGGRMTRVAA